MFSRNLNCRNQSANNVDSITHKKMVPVQRDNDIFNRYASLARKGVKIYRDDSPLRSDNSLNKEKVKMIYDNNKGNKTERLPLKRQSNELSLISKEKTEKKDIKKQLHKSTSFHKCRFVKEGETKQTITPCNNRKQNYLRSYSIVLNEEIAKYDLHERSKIYINNTIEQRIANREKLSKKATDYLISSRNNKALSLARKMESSQSMYDIRNWQKEREMKSKKEKTIILPPRPGLRREVTEYYEMNDKFIKNKNTILNKKEIQDKSFKEMKKIANQSMSLRERGNKKKQEVDSHIVIHKKPFFV